MLLDLISCIQILQEIEPFFGICSGFLKSKTFEFLPDLKKFDFKCLGFGQEHGFLFNKVFFVDLKNCLKRSKKKLHRSTNFLFFQHMEEFFQVCLKWSKLFPGVLWILECVFRTPKNGECIGVLLRLNIGVCLGLDLNLGIILGLRLTIGVWLGLTIGVCLGFGLTIGGC